MFKRRSFKIKENANLYTGAGMLAGTVALNWGSAERLMANNKGGSVYEQLGAGALLTCPILMMAFHKWEHAQRIVAVGGIIGSSLLIAHNILNQAAQSGPGYYVTAASMILANLYGLLMPKDHWEFADNLKHKTVKKIQQVLNAPLFASAVTKFFVTAPGMLLAAVQTAGPTGNFKFDVTKIITAVCWSLAFYAQSIAKQPDLKLTKKPLASTPR